MYMYIHIHICTCVQVVQDVLDHPQGLRWSEVLSISPSAHHDVALALTPLLFAPYLRARQDLDNITPFHTSHGCGEGGKASPEHLQGTGWLRLVGSL